MWPRSCLRIAAFAFLANCWQTSAQSSIDPCKKPEPCEETMPLVPDPDSCAKYFECIDHMWAHMTCSAGLMFDKIDLECVEEARCQESYTDSTTTTRTTTSTTTTTTTTTTAATTTTTTHGPPALDYCNRPEHCATSGNRIADPSSCKLYWVCELGSWVQEACPEDTLFDLSLFCLPELEAICHPPCSVTNPSSLLLAAVRSGKKEPDLSVKRTYNCDDRNPCTVESTKDERFRFPTDDPSQFVQCSETGDCHVVNCPKGQVFREDFVTCVSLQN